VSIRDTKVDVLLRCGEPTLREVIGSETKGRWVGGERFETGGVYHEYSQKVELWIYNLGTHKFIRILTFKGGVFEKMEIGDYGR
jgi:hypothetical protein